MVTMKKSVTMEAVKSLLLEWDGDGSGLEAVETAGGTLYKAADVIIQNEDIPGMTVTDSEGKETLVTDSVYNDMISRSLVGEGFAAKVAGLVWIAQKEAQAPGAKLPGGGIWLLKKQDGSYPKKVVLPAYREAFLQGEKPDGEQGESMGGGSWNDLKDRPFYEETTTVEVFPETSFNVESTGHLVEADIVLEEGKTYIVTWNGTEYTCTAILGNFGGENILYAGSIGMSGNGKPFAVVNYESGNAGFIPWNDKGTCTLSIKTETTIIKTINSKFLPEALQFGEVTVSVPLEITWDGDTTGRETHIINASNNLVTSLCKVSDKVLTLEDISSGTIEISQFGNSEFGAVGDANTMALDLTSSIGLESVGIVDVSAGVPLIASVKKDGVSPVSGEPITAGTYFAVVAQSNTVVQCVAGFSNPSAMVEETTIKTIDPKFLPEGVPYDSRNTKEVKIEWDGNIEGLVVDLNDWSYKVSDLTPSIDDFRAGAKAVLMENGERIERTFLPQVLANQINQREGYFECRVDGNDYVCVCTDPDAPDCPFPQTGIYFAKWDEGYVESFFYNKVVDGKFKPLDKAFLPDITCFVGAGGYLYSDRESMNDPDKRISSRPLLELYATGCRFYVEDVEIGAVMIPVTFATDPHWFGVGCICEVDGACVWRYFFSSEREM